MTEGRGETPPFPRDRPGTPFSLLLQRFVTAHAAVLDVTFVDGEGECIDYAARTDPFDAQLMGAQMQASTMDLVRCVPRLRAGALVLWVLAAERRDFVIRRVTDEHAVVVALSAGGLDARVLRAMAPLAEVLRREAALETPAWEPFGKPLRVHVRNSAWGYAPFAVGDGLLHLEVLGRWSEHGSISSEATTCFRVRCDQEEFTLVHDAAVDRWYRR